MPEDVPAARPRQAPVRARSTRSAAEREDALAARRKGESDAWGAMGLVVSGVLFWGGVGGLVTAWSGNRLPVMIGLLVGMFAGLYLVWFRYGRA